MSNVIWCIVRRKRWRTVQIICRINDCVADLLRSSVANWIHSSLLVHAASKVTSCFLLTWPPCYSVSVFFRFFLRFHTYKCSFICLCFFAYVCKLRHVHACVERWRHWAGSSRAGHRGTGTAAGEEPTHPGDLQLLLQSMCMMSMTYVGGILSWRQFITWHCMTAMSVCVYCSTARTVLALRSSLSSSHQSCIASLNTTP